MPTIYLPQEEDFRQWIRESIKTELQVLLGQQKPQPSGEDEPMLSRNDMAKDLGISLVTLTD